MARDMLVPMRPELLAALAAALGVPLAACADGAKSPVQATELVFVQPPDRFATPPAPRPTGDPRSSAPTSAPGDAPTSSTSAPDSAAPTVTPASFRVRDLRAMKLAQRCCSSGAICGMRVCYGTLTVGLVTSTPSAAEMLERFAAAFSSATPMLSRSAFVAQCTLLIAADGTVKATVSSTQLAAEVTSVIEAKLAAERFAPGAPGRLAFQVVNTW
jgi:hypothetical protein